MENEREQSYQSEGGGQSGDEPLSPEPETYEGGETGEVVPEVSVVRENTPRPHPFEAFLSASGRGQAVQEQSAARSAFPGQAPSAPPLPEELEDDEQEQGIDTTEVSVLSENTTVPQEFVWLFEYASGDGERLSE